MIAQLRVQHPIRVGIDIVEIRGNTECESRLSVDLHASQRDAFNIDYDGEFVPPDVPVVRVEANVAIESDRTWYLSDSGQLEELWSSATPLWPAGRFIVTERQGQLARWEFTRFGRLRLAKKDRAVTVTAPLLNRPACGLSVWRNASWVSRRRKIDLQILRTSLDRLDECAWIEPYPDGARAVICLTDHADFDSPEKLRLIADHLIRRGIFITKTVFPASDLPSLTPWEETGLDDPSYRESIDRLYEHGCEIAPHGFTPKRDAPSLSECRRRLELLRRYCLTTWIDHGTGDYLFSRGGRLADGVNLETLLEDNGVQNYWSYFDVWDNPFGKNFCVLSERFSLDAISDLMDGGHDWTNVKRRQALWFALHAFRNIVGDGNDVLIRRQPWRITAWQPALQWFETARQIRKSPLGIYGRDGAVFQQALQSTWVFDTVLLNHLALQLSPTKVDRLIETGGLLIAHCYMAFDHDYAHGNVFRCNGGLSIDPAFETALDHIANRQHTAAISTVSFVQLRRSLELFVRARLRRTETAWRVELSDPDGRSCGSGWTDGLLYKPRTKDGSNRGFGGVTFALPRKVLMERQNVSFN